MAENSKIEWTHHTANLWHGCTKVHAGCDHCYAETLSKRWKRDIWGNDSPRMMINSVWNDLKRYQKLAATAGEMHRVFVGSMMDIFEKRMELIDSKGEMVTDGIHVYPTFTDALRDQLFEEISDGKFPNLMFLFLTKRPSNINKMIPEAWKKDPPANVMFGTSPCDQETADKLIPQLLQVNGRRFLSVEPMLGPVDLTKYLCGIHWVICGGESGHGARPMHPDWVRYLRDQCEAVGVPFFFKQWGEYSPHMNNRNNAVPVRSSDGKIFKPGDVEARADCWLVERIGKKAAGRLLDEKLYDQFPEIVEKKFTSKI